MCGIAGFIDLKTRLSQPKMVKVGQSMGHVLSHRGPDAGDVWVDAETGVCLAHRRLTVVDLTETGHQPMESSCGQFVTIYNGEIYNAEELRTELLAKGRIFRGHSDTEVLVEGCAVWGVQEMAKRLVGMFAFAIWDKRERRLTLVRDRLGIKPLYWGLIGKQLLFGSELKALRTHPDCPKDVDRNAVASFLRYSNIPAPLTIYRGIEKLQPGHMLSFDGVKGIPIVESYWTLEDAVQTGKDNLLSGNDEEVIQEVGDLLEDSVKRRMVADVPLGAFLSGGIDSSTVVALMQKNSKTPIRSFSIGFEEKGYNEAQYAAAVAKHLKTDHTELYVTSQEAREVIPKLSDIYDEPFADSSQIPTYLVSALTRKHVTVALSGDGGDELFAGYNRYTTVERFQKMTRFTNQPMRQLISSAIRSCPTGVWDSILKFAPGAMRMSRPGEKMHRLSHIYSQDTESFYHNLVSHWDQPQKVAVGADNPLDMMENTPIPASVSNTVERMQYLDTMTYLPGDILTKVDRASMAKSLEVRVPILDHRLVELSWRLPQKFKIREGQSKWILRQILDQHVPRKLFDRPKVGFSVPVQAWLRGPLKEWAHELLSKDSIDRYGLMKWQPINQKWQEHLSGKHDWQYQLWSALMLQSWCQKWL